MKEILGALLCALLAVPLQAQSLSLLDAVRQAERTHPAMALASANVARARSGVREARAAQMPTLALDGNITEFEKPMVVAPLHGFDIRNPPVFDRLLSQGSMSAGYTLFDAARGARIERAQALAGAAQSSATGAQMQLLADVARAYLRVQSSREVAQAQQRRIAALTQEQSRAAQLVEQGRAARVVGLRAQAALSAATAENVAAASDVINSENDLARLLGVSVDSLRTLQLRSYPPGDAALPAVAQLQQQAHESNSDMLRLRGQLAAAEATRSEARGLWFPRLQLGGRYIDYASSKTSPKGEWQGGVQLSYPLLTGGTRLAAQDRAAAELQAARAELDLAQRRVDDAIDRAVAAVALARARVQSLRAAVAQSEEVSRIEHLALEAGAGVQSDYLTAEAELLRARAGLTDARALELMARVELARVTGQLTEDWIARNVESQQ